jgi:hypothetical protein
MTEDELSPGAVAAIPAIKINPNHSRITSLSKRLSRRTRNAGTGINRQINTSDRKHNNSRQRTNANKGIPRTCPKGNMSEDPLMNANVNQLCHRSPMSAQDAVEVVTMEDNNTRKKSIRGIVRKTNRIFNKVTNPDLDKPRIRVANFSA